MINVNMGEHSPATPPPHMVVGLYSTLPPLLVVLAGDYHEAFAILLRMI